MNNKFLSTISALAIAVVAIAPSSFAKTYTPSQFNAELKEKIGTKKGTPAVNAANSLFKSALKDKKNAKNADKYAKSIVSALKKPVPAALQGNAANTFVKTLTDGYFKAVKYNLNDSRYNKSILALLKGLPATERSKTPVSQKIYTTIKTYAIKKGSTQTDVFNYWNTKVANKAGIITSPPVVS